MRTTRFLCVAGLCLCVFSSSALLGCSSSNTTGNETNGGYGNNGMMGGNGTSGGQNNDGGSGTGPDGGPGSGPGGGQRGGTGGMMGGRGSGSGNYGSVGEQIYLSGVGSDGGDIQRTAPAVSQGSLMMGGGGCGSCHGANGKGGTIRMMSGNAIESPNVTYSELSGEGFTDATLARAIREGLDEEGKKLDIAMPRWQMSDGDVDATIAYLKTLND